MVANPSFIAALSSVSRGVALVRRAFLDEEAFGEVRGADPDTVPYRHPVDRDEHPNAVFEAATAAG